MNDHVSLLEHVWDAFSLVAFIIASVLTILAVMVYGLYTGHLWHSHF